MTRRGLFLMALAGLARADSAGDARDAVARMAQALGDGQAAEAANMLDPGMPGYRDLRAAMESLLARADVQSNIDILSNAGDDRARTLKLDWHLRVDQREGPRATTARQVGVTCRLENRGGHWLITSFEPASLFALPRGAEAWNVVQSAAEALSAGNPAGFLAFFDPAMPGYDTLRASATALAETSEADSSVELVSNDGGDSTRELAVDWTLDMVNPDTGIRQAQRQERVKLRLEWRDQRWRITRLDPLDFFRPAE